MSDSQDGQKATPVNNGSVPKHHWVRTPLASFLGAVSLVLIILSILGLWVKHTATNTNSYTRAIAPLVTKPEVQALVVDKASDALLENTDAPIRDIAAQLFGAAAIVNKTDQQLAAEVDPIVRGTVKSIVASKEFAELWESSNRAAHAVLMSQINSESTEARLNFQPLILGVLAKLEGTRLAFVNDKLELKEDSGIVVIKGDQLSKIKRAYNDFNAGVIWVILLALTFAGLSILVSVHHAKTLRRVAMGTGIATGFLAFLLILNPVGFGDNQAAAKVIVAQVTHSLRTLLIIIALVCIIGALASKFYPKLKTKIGTKES